MALNQNVIHAIKAKLTLGATAKEVADELEVPVSTVYIHKRKLDAESTLNKDLTEIPTEVLQTVVNESKKELTSKGASKELDAVMDAADGMKVLSRCYQKNLMVGLNRLGVILGDESTGIKDIVLCINTISKSHEQVFTSGTNIHIGDNNQSNQSLTIFKNKQGV